MSNKKYQTVSGWLFQPAVTATLLCLTVFLFLPAGLTSAKSTVTQTFERIEPDQVPEQALQQVLVIPGRVEQLQNSPAWPSTLKVSPYDESRYPKLTPIYPMVHLNGKQPGPKTFIPMGQVFWVSLAAPLHSTRVYPGDQIELSLLDGLQSDDGLWTLPVGSKIHAKVESLDPARHTLSPAKLGVLFYEVLTPDGWLVPIEGRVLASNKQLRGTHRQGGLVQFAKGNPKGGYRRQTTDSVPEHASAQLRFWLGLGGKEVMLEAGDKIPVRLEQPVFYQSTLAYQDHRHTLPHRNQEAEGQTDTVSRATKNTTDAPSVKGVVPVGYYLDHPALLEPMYYDPPSSDYRDSGYPGAQWK